MPRTRSLPRLRTTARTMSVLCLALGLAACSSGGSNAKADRTRTSTSTTASTTTTSSTSTSTTSTTTARLTPAGSTESTEPCGGAATVSAVVHASPAGGLSETSGQYDVEHIVISATDPHWAVAATIPHPDAQLQGAQVILYCTGDRWTVTDLGSSDYGCNDSPTGPAVPADVRADLGVQCTGY